MAGEKGPWRQDSVSATDHAVDPGDDSSDAECGIGSFKPAWLQMFNNPKVFFLIHCVESIFEGAMISHLIGCITTLEKRFDFDTKISGFILLSEDIAPIIAAVLIGYFGDKSHKPRVIASGMIVVGIGSLIVSLPYFIYGADYPTKVSGASSTVANSWETGDTEFCTQEQKEESCLRSPTTLAVTLLFLGQFVKGFGSPAYYTVGTSFVDDSFKKAESPTYFGVLMALRLLGPVTGSLLASFCLQFYEDPFHDPGFDQNDPRWVGAWWMGFVFISLSTFLFAIPMLLFPRQFRRTEKSPMPLKRENRTSTKSPLQEFKGLFQAILRLAKNPILALDYIGAVLRLNGLMGFFILLPKYMEVQFRQSASKANLYSGPASIIGMHIGIVVGGIIITKFKPTPRVLCGGITLVESFSIIGLLSCMFITCPAYQLPGTGMAGENRLDLLNECNMNCSCTLKQFTPVCGPDGVSTYFSPCFAGCSGLNITSDGKEVLTGCKCVHDEKGNFITDNALNDYCGATCQWMIVYVVVLTIGKTLSSTARVGNVLVTLRCVHPHDRSVGLGVLSAMFSIFGLIPHPLIYGALADASCLVWEKSCGKTGNCWIYDSDKFRYLLHGVSLAFVVLGSVTDIGVWVLSSRLGNLYEDPEERIKPTSTEVLALKNTENSDKSALSDNANESITST